MYYVLQFTVFLLTKHTKHTKLQVPLARVKQYLVSPTVLERLQRGIELFVVEDRHSLKSAVNDDRPAPVIEYVGYGDSDADNSMSSSGGGGGGCKTGEVTPAGANTTTTSMSSMDSQSTTSTSTSLSPNSMEQNLAQSVDSESNSGAGGRDDGACESDHGTEIPANTATADQDPRLPLPVPVSVPQQQTQTQKVGGGLKSSISPLAAVTLQDLVERLWCRRNSVSHQSGYDHSKRFPRSYVVGEPTTKSGKSSGKDKDKRTHKKKKDDCVTM